MFAKNVREVSDDGTEQNQVLKQPERPEDGIIDPNYLASVGNKTASEKLNQPGDFYYAKPNPESRWNNPYVIINCPYCNCPFALTWQKILNFPGEPLTIQEDIKCAYNQAHHFRITYGEVIPLGTLK